MLRVKLLGTPQVSLNDRPLSPALAGRGLGLFAYIATNREAHPRTILADLLWTGLGEQQARANLRSLLYYLRQILGDYLLVTRYTVALNRECPYWLDVEVFANVTAAPASHDPTLLTELLNLYQQDFLNGFSVENAPVFEAWLIEQRRRLRNQALTGWQQLVHDYQTKQHYEAGLVANLRLLDLEPWNEEAHRQQMNFFIATGQRNAALAQYEHCCQILREELDVSPSAETIALYQQIKGPPTTDTLAYPLPTAATATSRTSLRVDWGAMPIAQQFLGRQHELATLYQWVVTERTRAVAIVGMGGQGKTTIAAHFVQTLTTSAAPDASSTATSAPFEGIIWRSLLHAPPLADILQDWLYQLSDQQIVTLPRTLDGQLALLADYLQQRRFLLVLDNVESIVVAATAGKNEAYAAYQQLWQLFLEREHHSCLLVTSRESMHKIYRQTEQPGLFRQLLLDGLTTTAGEQLLKRHGLQENRAAFTDLHQRYSGNPLALTLVAQAIDEFFAGDVVAFLQEDLLFFGDIDTLLDQQFTRLAPLEAELLTWLALEQEPVCSQQLWQNLVAPPARRDFLTALRTLLHRSLIQQQGTNFGVQNVILEYVRNRLLEEIYQELTDERMTRWQDDKMTEEQEETETRRQRSMLVSSSHPAERTAQLRPRFSASPDLGALSRVVTLSKLNRYALSKAQAKEHIRVGQERLLLAPLLQRLLQYWGQDGLTKLVQRLLAALRQAHAIGAPLTAGYAAANLLHLLLHLNATVRGYDFSLLTLRQAYLRNVQLYDLNLTGATLHDCAFTDAFAATNAVVFHPTGEWLAVGTYHGAIRFWRLGDNQFYDTFAAHQYLITALAISPDGCWLASGSIDSKVYLWDVETHTARYCWPEKVDYLRGLTFSPDGQWLVVPGADGLVKFYAVTSGVLTYTLQCPSRQLWSVAFSPDGQWLAGGSSEGPIYLWSVATLTATAPNSPWQCLPGHQGAVDTLLFSADSCSLYSGGHDPLIYRWDVHSLAANQPAPDRPQLTLRGHHFYVRSLALSPNGQCLASGGADCTVRLWDVHSGALMDTLVGHDRWVWKVAFQPRPPTGRSAERLQLLVSVGDDQRILTWEIDCQRRAEAYPEDTYPCRRPKVRGRIYQVLQGYTDVLYGAAFTPDSALLLSAGFDRQVRVWDVQTGSLCVTFNHHNRWIFSLAISSSGQTVAWGDSEGKVWLWSQATATLPMRLQDHRAAPSPQLLDGHAFPVLDLTFCADGQTVASCSMDQTIGLWDVASGQLLQRLTGHAGMVWAGAFSPDSQLFASASTDGTIRLWEVDALVHRRAGAVTLQQILTGHSGPVKTVAFSIDGERLVSGSNDQTIRIWDRNGQPLQVLTGHTSHLMALAVNPRMVNGRQTFASCDGDQHLRLWDLASGELLHAWQEPKGEIYKLIYSPNGKLLAGANRDGYLRLWDGQTGAVIKTLQVTKPYAGTVIDRVSGITAAQMAALRALGAIDQAK